MIGFGKSSGKALDLQGHCLLGLLSDTKEPLIAPRGSRLLESAIGGGKTTKGAVPWIMSLASETAVAQLITDSKDGELAAQLCQMLSDMGRFVVVIDEFRVRPELEPWRVNLNPFGSAVSTFRSDTRDVIFANENITNALIAEPSTGETKDKYFRDLPREYIELALHILLNRDPMLATPGGISALLSDPEMFLSLAKIEKEEGSDASQSLANSVVSLEGHEHFYQHLNEAKRSLRIFGPGTRLAEAGREAAKTHEDLIREGAIIFLCGPQRFMTRLGAYYALHILAFTDALYNGAGQLRITADEYTNTPIKPLIEQMTTLRAYGCEIYFIRQSRSESIRKFGEKENDTLEENCIVKQWFGGFSSFEEATRVSKVMGEEHAIASSLGGDSTGTKLQTNLRMVKQPVMTPAELMAMEPHQQLIHIKGVGFFVADTISQENIAPYCDLIADNPLEGGRLEPDPKIKLATPKKC